MKTIGLLGGMSWESTVLYYRWINEAVKQRLGGLHSARIVMLSVDFQEIEDLQRAGRWEESGHVLGKNAAQLQAAGADFLVICTNTMHLVVPQIEEHISIPILHIADATADAIREAHIQCVGLLGTKFTMEKDFYAGRLQKKHGLQVLTPSAADREIVHRVIYEELVLGLVKEESRAEYVRIIQSLQEQGAQGVIAGCTEIGILVKQADSPLPLFDTARVHALSAVDLALSD